MSKLIGKAPHQVPTNADLGTLAFQDSKSARINQAQIDTLKNVPDLENDYPTVRPAFVNDFANAKEIDPRLQFIRSTSGSYYDEQGVIQYAGANEPRFDHDPITGECKGLLIEYAKTNYCYHSREPRGIGLSNAVGEVVKEFAPDGGDAYKFTTTSGATGRATIRNYDADKNGWAYAASVSANATVTHSVFVHPGTWGRIWSIWDDIGGSSYAGAGVKITLPTDGTNFYYHTEDWNSSGNPVTVRAEHVGRDWWRLSVTFVTTTGSTIIAVMAGDVNNNPTYAGEHFYGWGIQSEEASYPSSFISTGHNQVTRGVDIAEMYEDDVKQIYNQYSSSVYIDFIPIARTGLNTFAMSIGSSNTNYWGFAYCGQSDLPTAQVYLREATGSSFTWYNLEAEEWDEENHVYNQSIKQAAAGNTASWSTAQNGRDDFLEYNFSVNNHSGLPRWDSTSNAFTLKIGPTHFSNSTGFYHIRKIATYKQKLTNANLRAITEN